MNPDIDQQLQAIQAELTKANESVGSRMLFAQQRAIPLMLELVILLREVLKND